MSIHNQKRLLCCIVSLLMTLLLSVTAYAHAAFVTEVEPGFIRFHYDDDSPMAKAFITVYDLEGNEIETSQTDKNGLFDYNGYENAGVISAGDPGGHHVDFIINDGAAHQAYEDGREAEEPQVLQAGLASVQGRGERSGPNQTVTVAAVVVVIAAVAGGFYVWNKKKANKF